jgi:hypothetical protein
MFHQTIQSSSSSAPAPSTIKPARTDSPPNPKNAKPSQEWVLNVENGHFDKEPVDFIFDENGHLNPTYQAIDLPPRACKATITVKSSGNLLPQVLGKKKIPMTVRYQRIRGRHTQLFMKVPWA